MRKQQIIYKYYVGYYCHDGSFAILIKNQEGIGFDTRKEAEEYIEKVQPKYKHHLGVWHNI